MEYDSASEGISSIMMNILRALFWSFVVVGLAFVYRACAQELPDAPQAQTITCSQAAFDENMHITYKTIPCTWQASWRELPAPPPKKVTFFTFRKNPKTDPPLRTARGAFTKKFVALHLGAAMAMGFACHNKNSGEEWGSEAPVVGAITGLDWIMSRFFSEAMSVEAPVYMMAHYSKAAAK